MKNKRILLPLVLLAALSLAGCNNNKPSSSTPSEPSSSSSEATSSEQASSETSASDSESSSESSESIVYAVSIANKSDLTAEWHPGGASRSMTIDLTPEANPLVEIQSGNLTIASSNEDVVKATGLNLAALAVGTATITVTYHGETDSVAIEVTEEPVTPRVASKISDLVASAQKDDEISFNGIFMGETNVLHTFNAGKDNETVVHPYVYFDDGTGAMLCYQVKDDEMKGINVGDACAIDAVYSPYNGLPETKSQSATVSVINEAITPQADIHIGGENHPTLAKADANRKVVIEQAEVKAVTIASDGSYNYTPDGSSVDVDKATIKLTVGGTDYNLTIREKYCTFTDAIRNLSVGDKFSCTSFVNVNGSTVDLAHALNPVRVAGDATLNKTIPEQVEVTGLKDSYKNGDTVEFTVAIKAAYQAAYTLGAVTLDGNPLTADPVTGKYSFVVNGTMALVINVVDNSKYATSVTVSAAGDATELEVGSTLQMSAVVAGDDGVSQDVTWESSDETKATVTAAGLVTAHAAGSVTITATAVATDSLGNPVDDTYALTINAKHGTVIDDPLTALEAYELGAPLGYNVKSEEVYYVKGVITSFYNATTPYLDKTNFEVELADWGVNAGKLVKGAEVIAHGKLHSGGASWVKLDANTIGIDSVDNSKVRLIEISGESTVVVNETTPLTAAAYPGALAVTTFTWTSADETIATVDNDGTVHGVALGDTTITAAVMDGLEVVASATKAIGVEAAQVVYKTARFGSAASDAESCNSYNNGSTHYETTDGFRVDVTNGSNNNKAWNIIAFGQKVTADLVGTIVTHEAIDAAVTKVVINITQANSPAYVDYIKLYTSSNGTDWTEQGSFTYAVGEQKVAIASPAANLYYKVEIKTQASGSNGIARFGSVSFYKAA